MRWPSKRASRLCLRFLCLVEWDESQCFRFSMRFWGLVKAELEVLTEFCAVCSLSMPFWSTPCPLARASVLPWEVSRSLKIFPSLNVGIIVEECLLSAPLSLLFDECLCSWVLWFTACNDLSLAAFLGNLTSEPVPVSKTNVKTCEWTYQTEFSNV